MTMPHISIIIPTYNHCDDLLKPCCEAIIQYTDLSDIEVLVVANGCTDNTKEYVESLGGAFKLIWVEEKMGYTRSNNLGIKAAKGDFLIFMNNDVFLLPQATHAWINQLHEPFSDPQVGLVGCHKRWSHETNSYFFCFYMVMIKREVIDRVGLPDDIFSPGFGEDIDYCKRMEIAGYKLVNCDRMMEENVPKANPDQQIIIGDFPLYHPGTSTFHDPEHVKKYEKIVQRNISILSNRYAGEKLKLNLGCGDLHVEGYLGIDQYDKRADVMADIKNLPFPDQSISDIIAYHCLEHITPYDFNKVLAECQRVLIPGGSLAIEMPDIVAICRDFESANKSHRYDLLNFIYGYGELPGHHHYWGWYDEILYDHLAQYGFENIRRVDPKFHLHIKNYCLRMEATKQREDKSAPKYSVIIPTWNHCDDLLKPCCASLIKHTDPNNVEIIVVANGCTDNTREYVESLGKPFKLVWIDEQCGYIKAINKGIAASSGQYVVLLNNDAAILDIELIPGQPRQKNDWLLMLEQPFLTDPNTGITGPTKMNCSFAKIQYIIFFCAMISRKVINTIGVLDERYGMGYMDDQDYCLRAIKAGFTIHQVPDENLMAKKNTNEGQFDCGGFPIYHASNRSFSQSDKSYASRIKTNMHTLLDIHYPNDVVHVVVPTYKRYNMLREALKSVLTQTYKKIRVWVVSDGPDARVQSIVEEFNKLYLSPELQAINGSEYNYILFNYLYLDRHEGALGGRPRIMGIDALPEQGYVCFLDDDNLMHPEYAAKLHDAVRESGTDIAYCQIKHSHIDHMIPRDGKLVMGEVDSLNYLVANRIAKQCKEKWLHNPASLLICHDFEFIDACTKLGATIYVPEVLGEHRRTETGYTEVDDSKPKVYDCFPFFNELDVIEIRFNELDSVVDYFVLAEATKTHSGKPKPLYFNENKERYAKFLHKIRHIIVDDFPETNDPWVRKKWQRDKIAEELKDCRDNDIIVLSDADEIVSADVVRNYKPEMGLCAVQQKLSYYYLNCQTNDIWVKPRIFPYKEKGNSTMSAFRSERDYEYTQIIPNGGWHFSFLHDSAGIANKIESYAHQEFNSSEFTSKENIEEAMRLGHDVFKRNQQFHVVPIDQSFPVYLLQNLDKFKPFIANDKADKQQQILDKFKSEYYHCSPYREIFDKNAYDVQPEEVAGRTVIDVGGHEAYFAIYAVTQGADKVYCVEPNPKSYQTLLVHTAPFDNIIPVNLAVMRPGLKQAHMAKEGILCEVREEGDGELTKCISLEELVRYILGDDLVLKLDCEGSEYDIIYTCPPEVIKRFKYIYMELHRSKKDDDRPEILERYINSLGYESKEKQLVWGNQWGWFVTDAQGQVVDFVPRSEEIDQKLVKFTRDDLACKDNSRQIVIDELHKKFNHQFNEVFVWNTYDLELQEVAGKTVVDIGGNEGIFSMYATVNCADKVYCVEPDPTNYQKMLQNITPFKNIVPVNVAVTKPGVKQSHMQLEGVMCRLHEGGDGVVVNCVSLEELVKDIPGDDLVLKLDCEGSEYDIVFNCPPEVIRRFKCIYTELHSKLLSQDDSHVPDVFVKYLENLGYKSKQKKMCWGWWVYDAQGQPMEFVPDPVTPDVFNFKFIRQDEMPVLTPSKPKVYDCFPFFNELDLLEVRLNELDGVVDCFVLAEATKTHSGKDKPLYFNENKGRFAKFLPKIKHIIVDDFPETTDPWVRERHQREALMRGLGECSDSDIIISTDLDEIPRAKVVTEYKAEQGVMGLELDYSFYYFNCVRTDKGTTHARILPFGLLRTMGHCHFRYEKCPLVKNAGWHFSFMGGPEGILKKFDSYAHQEYNTGYYKDVNRLQKFLDGGGDMLEKNMDFQFRDMDATFPKYVMDNLDRFVKSGYVKPLQKEPIVKEEEIAVKPVSLSSAYPTGKSVTAYASTKDRVWTTLPSMILSVIQQTVKPTRLVLFFDGEHLDVRDNDLYRSLFHMLSMSGIEWEVVFGEGKGQVLNHNKMLDMAKTDLLWRIDDDDFPQPDVLEKLLSCMQDPKVGAVGGIIIDPTFGFNNLPPNFDTTIHNLESNCQWFVHEKQETIQVEHLYNSFLFRKEAAKHGYCLDLSPAGHREETMFTYEMHRAGWKVLVNPKALTWHAKQGKGGIRTYESHPEYWAHDEEVFGKKMKEWGVKTKQQKLIILDNGKGDHVMLKMILPEIRKKFPDMQLVIGVSYPEIFEDEPDVKMISIADAKNLCEKIGIPYASFDIYKFAAERGWKTSFADAFRKMYLEVLL